MTPFGTLTAASGTSVQTGTIALLDSSKEKIAAKKPSEPTGSIAEGFKQDMKNFTYNPNNPIPPKGCGGSLDIGGGSSSGTYTAAAAPTSSGCSAPSAGTLS